MSQPQHRTRDCVETAQSEAAASAAHYSEAVDLAGAGAVAGIHTGDWSGYAGAFQLLQHAAWNALTRRRHADMATQLFGGTR